MNEVNYADTGREVDKLARERFREVGKGSFFGAIVYDRVVPKEHFFRKLNEAVDWGRFTQKLVRYYKGGAEYGPPPYEPVVLLKMLLVAYLYGISERQTEELVDYHLPAKYFVGLGVDEKAPDHSTLTVFKERLLARKGTQAYEDLFGRILKEAKARGIKLGPIQVVDSVHTIADVNVEKNEGRQKKGKGPRDPDARWGVKGTKRVRDEEGQERRQREYFYGYKAHVSLNAQTGLITSLEVSPGLAYDGHHLPSLVAGDLAQGIGAEIYAGDRGYDDGDNHEFLRHRGLKSALRLNDYRTRKKDAHKEPWLKLVADPDYWRGLRERYKIERKFGEAKLWHGLRRCRYLGLARYAIQSYLTAMTLNLKRLVKLLFGIGFRNQGNAAFRAA